jgi:hypothetical protein
MHYWLVTRIMHSRALSHASQELPRVRYARMRAKTVRHAFAVRAFDPQRYDMSASCPLLFKHMHKPSSTQTWTCSVDRLNQVNTGFWWAT